MKQLKPTKFIVKFDLILERVVTRTSYDLFDLDKSGVKQLILFENLFKPRQLRLAVYVLLTSSVLSTTSKRCFEQPAALFIVCSLIFIEYKFEIKFIKKTIQLDEAILCQKNPKHPKVVSNVQFYISKTESIICSVSISLKRGGFII